MTSLFIGETGWYLLLMGDRFRLPCRDVHPAFSMTLPEPTTLAVSLGVKTFSVMKRRKLEEVDQIRN